jgi:alkylation response protein AidB-like acyl-CoA dehydrogenase
LVTFPCCHDASPAIARSSGTTSRRPLGDFEGYAFASSNHAARVARQPARNQRLPETFDKVLNPMTTTLPLSEKTDEQRAITEMVRQFADEQIIPNAEHYDREDSFPEPIVEQMKELGLFGVTIPEEYGGMGLDLTTYTMIVEELSRGWISISGIVNTHFIGSYLLMKFGTEEQRQRYLPRMATGEIRAAFSLSEPECGSDVQAVKTTARKIDAGGRYEINGTKMWVTNGLLSSIVFVLVKTDPQAQPKYKGMTCFVAEKEPGVSENTGPYEGFNVPPKIKKLGYKGVESTELVFDGYKTPAESILGGEEQGLGQGFVQMMDALEVGRVNVAARGVGIAQRALELALRYSQERKTFGKQISQHQAIQFKLADMATQVEAARLLTLRAARLKDAGERSDLEAGMAKLFASEAARFCVEEGFRIHGGYGYSKEYEIERLYRDAPLLLIGEGTSEIQRMVIGRKLLQRHKV